MSAEAATETGYGMRQGEVLFSNIDGGQSVTEIESLCMNCHENVCPFGLLVMPCHNGQFNPVFNQFKPSLTALSGNNKAIAHKDSAFQGNRSHGFW